MNFFSTVNNFDFCSHVKKLLSGMAVESRSCSLFKGDFSHPWKFAEPISKTLNLSDLNVIRPVLFIEEEFMSKIVLQDIVLLEFLQNEPLK